MLIVCEYSVGSRRLHLIMQQQQKLYFKGSLMSYDVLMLRVL